MNLFQMSTISDIGGYHQVMSTRTFGEWLRREIERREWTQIQFADIAGVSQTTVSSWINDVQPPTKRNCRRIADAFGIDRNTVYELAGRGPDFDVPKLPDNPTMPSVDRNVTSMQDVIERLNNIERGG